MVKIALTLTLVGWLVGCSAGTHKAAASADIAKIAAVKSSFGPDFTVVEVPLRAIDPQFFSTRKLPDGLSFDPANCRKLAAGPDMPPGVQGNMAALSAEGRGNRFVVIAVETSQPLPPNDPGEDCTHVAFAGAQVRGRIEVVDVPRIDGAQTRGVHRVLQMMICEAPRTGELYDYSAQFGNYQVIVIANPLVLPGRPVVPVDTEQAREVLVKGVAAVRR